MPRLVELVVAVVPSWSLGRVLWVGECVIGCVCGVVCGERQSAVVESVVVCNLGTHLSRGVRMGAAAAGLGDETAEFTIAEPRVLRVRMLLREAPLIGLGFLVLGRYLLNFCPFARKYSFLKMLKIRFTDIPLAQPLHPFSYRLFGNHHFCILAVLMKRKALTLDEQLESQGLDTSGYYSNKRAR
jgi:hypothetical protein